MLAFATNIFAQTSLPITKGNYMLGGSFYSQYFDNDNFKYFGIGLHPDVGYFIIDNLAVGVEPSVTYTSYTYPESSDDFSDFGLSVYGKYYTNLGFFGMASVGGFFGPEREPSYNINPRIGYAYFINAKVSLEGMLGTYIMYNNSKFDVNELLFSVGFQVFL